MFLDWIAQLRLLQHDPRTLIPFSFTPMSDSICYFFIIRDEHTWITSTIHSTCAYIGNHKLSPTCSRKAFAWSEHLCIPSTRQMVHGSTGPRVQPSTRGHGNHQQRREHICPVVIWTSHATGSSSQRWARTRVLSDHFSSILSPLPTSHNSNPSEPQIQQ